MIGSQCHGISVCADETIETVEELSQGPIETHENVLNLVAVRTEIVSDLVERREADSDHIGPRRLAEMHLPRDVEGHPGKIFIRVGTALPLIVKSCIRR